MSIIDVQKLLGPVAPDNPAGPNLEYDPGFVELERLVAGKPEQQMGAEIIPGEEPNWKEIKPRSVVLLARSKDLRVGLHLAKALVKTDGLAGLGDALELLRGFVEQFWETVHPQLDPDDGNDPTMRVNILAALLHEGMLKSIREAPMLVCRAGRFSMRDVLVAMGRLPAPTAGEAPVPPVTTIEGGFSDIELDKLQEVANEVTRALEQTQAIESILTAKVGVARAADFTPAAGLLKAAQKVLSDRLVQRGVGVPGEAGPAEAVGGVTGAAPGAPRPMTGEILTREDAIRVLEKVIDYFNKAEPSSPVPILLRRARRLVSKNFMEILKDLAPDGLKEAEKIRGGED